jgi:hypothetical protein
LSAIFFIEKSEAPKPMDAAELLMLLLVVTIDPKPSTSGSSAGPLCSASSFWFSDISHSPFRRATVWPHHSQTKDSSKGYTWRRKAEVTRTDAVPGRITGDKRPAGRGDSRTWAAIAHRTVLTWNGLNSGCLEGISAAMPAM